MNGNFFSAYAINTSANLWPGMGMCGLGAVLIAYAGAPAPGGKSRIRKRTRTKSTMNNPEIKNTNPIDFPWCLSFFEKRGKELFGEKFKIHDEDHDIIYKLIIYFLRHESEAKRLNLDLNKGILLTGPIGCGKTSLMTLMRFIPMPEKNFMMKHCRDVSFEFIKEGYEVITRYTKMSFSGYCPKIFCFDDLGAEQSIKYYGNECNVMDVFLQSRYDLFISSRMITHITTNLNASDLSHSYGDRLRSRLRVMFNMLSFQTLDKRT